MVIIVKIKYPVQSAKQMASKFFEAPAFPDFITMRGPYFNSMLQGGMLVTAILELKEKNKFVEGMDFTRNYLGNFYDIPGFS